MLLSCPNCQTEYDVPDAALTGRARKLRCANCMTTWTAPALEMYREPEPAAPDLPEAVAETPETEPVLVEDTGQTVVIAGDAAIAGIGEVVQEPAPEPPERMRFSKPSREPPATLPAPSAKRGLGKSILIVVLVIVVVLLAHRLIGHIWPPSLRLFNALGLRS